MLTYMQQLGLLNPTTDDETRVLKYLMKPLSAKCNACKKKRIAVWDIRSDGKAGRYQCTECGEYGTWTASMEDTDYHNINWRYL